MKWPKLLQAPNKKRRSYREKVSAEMDFSYQVHKILKWDNYFGKSCKKSRKNNSKVQSNMIKAVKTKTHRANEKHKVNSIEIDVK